MVKLIKNYMKIHKIYLFTAIILSLVCSSFSIIKPYLISNFIDNLNINSNNKFIYEFIIVLALIFLFEVIFIYIKSMIYSKLIMITSFNLNYDMLEHVKKLPLSYINNIDTTYMNQRINVDSNDIISFSINTVVGVLLNIFTIVVTFVIMIKMSTSITLLLFILIPINIVNYNLFKKDIFKANYKLKENYSKNFSKMNSQLSNIKFIKINACFKSLGKQLQTSFASLLEAYMKNVKVSMLFSSSNLNISNIAMLILCFFGGIKIINGKLTIGEFIAINTYFSMIMKSVDFFLKVGEEYQKTLVSYERLKEILNINIEHNGDVKLSEISIIELKNVSFSYNNSNPILSNFSYKFEKGKIYGIQGKNGSGKSTLVNIILGLFNTINGDIYYNFVDIKDVDLYHARKNLVGVCEQEPILINDSIRNNIIYGLEDFKEEYLENNLAYYSKALNLNNFIKTLPNGLDSNISERASNVSGGEKQKISQLKAFIKDPDVLVLDEPNSALDKESTEALKNFINGIKKDKIIITIAHDNEILNICDHIINL